MTLSKSHINSSPPENTKIIENYPNYSISPDGIVYSLNQNIVLTLKPRKLTGGLRVKLHHEGMCLFVYVDRLVAETYIPNELSNYLEVEHIDGDLSNNHVSNLRWSTPRDSQLEAYKRSIKDKDAPLGPIAKYSVETIHMLCESIVNEDLSLPQLVVKFGLPARLIRTIRNGKVWRFISKQYWDNPPEIISDMQKFKNKMLAHS